MGRAVRAHPGAIDAELVGHLGLRHKLGKDARPDALPAPAIEAVLDRGGRAVDGGAVLPAAARLEDEDDPADDAAVVNAPCAGLVLRQERLYRRPSSIRQPKVS